MIAELKPKEQKKPRNPAKRITFTELALARLKAPKVGQKVYWDTGTKGQLGLAVLVSAGGAKTYRATFQLNGTFRSDKIGRVGEMDLVKARETTLAYRKMAADEVDPRAPNKSKQVLYRAVMDQFIEHYAKPRQRTWDQTQRVLKNTCKPFLNRPFRAITKQDAYELLDRFKADGNDYKGAVTLRWLKTLWKWAKRRDYVEKNVMEDVHIDWEKREWDRVFSADEIEQTWEAAKKLDRAEEAYVKLMVLLAPRKTALAYMKRTDLDNSDNPTLWITPFELTKSRKTTKKKRVYLAPLPRLARNIIKGLPQDDADGRLFATLPVHVTKGGSRTFYSNDLKHKLVEAGAPKDFAFKTWRHTISTFLQNAGHSEWECGLALNHSGSGSVTAGYSHGYPLELKRKLLEEWADHVEAIVTGSAGVKLVR